MNYIFDTNIVLVYLREDRTRNMIESTYYPFRKGNKALISIVSVGEIRSIAMRNRWGVKKIQAVEQFLKRFIILDIRFSEMIDVYAKIDTFSQGKLLDKPLPMTPRNMGKNDLWIAAAAHTTRSKLLTMDKDFSHLDGTFVELVFVERVI